MPERLTDEQRKLAKEKSKLFENAWRVFTHPKEHSLKEVTEAGNFLTSQINNYRTAITFEGHAVDAETLDKVFMGVLHYPDFQIPPELKYHPRSN